MTTFTGICRTFVKVFIERNAVYKMLAEEWNACFLLHTLSFKTLPSLRQIKPASLRFVYVSLLLYLTMNKGFWNTRELLLYYSASYETQKEFHTFTPYDAIYIYTGCFRRYSKYFMRW
jgi:hypothetical protein